MCDVKNVEDQAQPERVTIKQKLGEGMRVFSVESTGSSLRLNNEARPYTYDYSLCGKDFLLKLVQILLGVTSAGLYSRGFNVMLLKHIRVTSQCNITADHFSMPMFPNIVFGAFITITSVIAISYVLGQAMSEFLIRIFNAIGTVLYFVTACATGHVAYTLLRETEEDMAKENQVTSMWMLAAQVFTSSLNCLLYGLDLAFSVRRAFKAVEVT